MFKFLINTDIKIKLYILNMSNLPRQAVLFISGLDKAVKEEHLYSIFNEYPISYLKIAKDHSNKESYGYAFVGFKSTQKG